MAKAWSKNRYGYHSLTSVHEKCVARVHVSEFPCYGKSDSFNESVLLKNRFKDMIRYYFTGTHVARSISKSFFALLMLIPILNE